MFRRDFQLPIDALGLDMSPLTLASLQKATSELGIGRFSTDGDTENDMDTLESMLSSQSLSET